jgi:uncharacterized OB-fold protein
LHGHLGSDATFGGDAASLAVHSCLEFDLLRVCETRCQQCGAAIVRDRSRQVCERCEAKDLAKRPIVSDKAVVETADAGDFEPERLPKTG